MLRKHTNNRATRALIAAETIQIIERGQYESAAKKTVSIGNGLQAMQEGTRLYTPEQGLNVAHKWADAEVKPPTCTLFEVANETTLHAARRLIESGFENLVALNFASAKNPGGGFTTGAQAQEESLARASALYASLMSKMPFYEANRNHESALYTDHAIYSPTVPVFRDDDDNLLDHPHAVSFITMPAVNAGAIQQNEPHRTGQIAEVMRRRVRILLSIAAEHGHRSIVLGAWGCGVFRNSPADVANWFWECLANGGPFSRTFERVTFAVLDRDEKHATIQPFENRFR